MSSQNSNMIHDRFGAPLAANFKARWYIQIKETIVREFRFFSLEFSHLFTPFRFRSSVSLIRGNANRRVSPAAG
jgi:hypothetical protein